MKVLLFAVWDISALLGLRRNKKTHWNLKAFGWRGCCKGTWKTFASHWLPSQQQPGWGGHATSFVLCAPSSDLCSAVSVLFEWPGRGKEEHTEETAGLTGKIVLQ